jgi:hypothetical protein
MIEYNLNDHVKEDKMGRARSTERLNAYMV